MQFLQIMLIDRKEVKYCTILHMWCLSDVVG